MIRAFLVLLCVFTSKAHAGSWEGVIAIESRSYEGGGSRSGTSAALRYFDVASGGGDGFFIYNKFPGVHFSVYDASAGYGLRSGGNYFWEAGAGVRAAKLWGFGATAFVGVGLRAGSWVVALPVWVHYPSYPNRLEFSPLIGWSF